MCACHHYSEVISPHTDARDVLDQTPLYDACEEGIQVVQYLVEVLKVDVGESFL